MSLYENSIEAQRGRHDLPAGFYPVDMVTAFRGRNGRDCIRLSIRWASDEPFSDMGLGCAPSPVCFAPHEPLVDALCALEPGAVEEPTRRGGMHTHPIWLVELGPGGRVMGFTRATEVRGLPVVVWSQRLEPQDRDAYWPEEMRRKGHRY